MKDFVVYTVLTGDKGDLRNPFPENVSGFERICFTDNPQLKSKDWDIVLMDNHYLKSERESRRAKLLPHMFLSDFDSSLYIDNTVSFMCNPLDIKRTYMDGNSQKSFFCFAHPSRKCLYDEGEVVIQYGIDNEYRVREQLDFYASAGYPKNKGLIAGTVLLRKHLEVESIDFHELWFEHVIRYSKRDQISFNFVAWLKKFTYSHFEGSLLSNPYIRWEQNIPSHLPRDFDEKFYIWLNPEIISQDLNPRQHYLTIGIKRHLPYKRFSWELSYLANKYRTDKGDFYYNRHGYAAIYQAYLGFLKNLSFVLVEVGLLRHDVQAINPSGPYDDAPSLKMWKEFFPFAKIYGFDIASFSAFNCPENVEIIRGDASKAEDLLSLIKYIDDYLDVVIDDASHASHHQQIALSSLFQYLRSGGYYIIEDLHYQPKQLEISGTPKTQYILSELCRGNLVQSDHLKEATLEYLRDNIEFIHFYDSQDRNFGTLYRDSLAVIKKKVQAQQKICFCIFMECDNLNLQVYESLRKLLARLIVNDKEFKILLHFSEESKSKKVNFIDDFKAFWLINENSRLDNVRFFVVDDNDLCLWLGISFYYFIFIFNNQTGLHSYADYLDFSHPLLVLGTQNLLMLPDWEMAPEDVAREVFNTTYEAYLQLNIQPLNILISSEGLTHECQQELFANLVFSLALEYNIDTSRDLIISPVPHLEEYNWSKLSVFLDGRLHLSIENHHLLNSESIVCLPVINL